MEVDVKDLKNMYQRLARLEEMRVKHEEKLDQNNDEIKTLKEDHQAIRNRWVETQTAINKTNDKLFQVETFAGVINRRVDNIESYRDFKEKRYEELKQKLGIIISATLISIFVFTIGYCCGVLQWK